MRAAGYIRVSTEEQVKHGWNLGADRERIEATIAEQGWDRHDIYDDGGKQGDDPNREDFLRMLAEADEYDVLIMRDLDRFSRRLAIYAMAVDELVAADVTIYEFAGDEGTGIRKLDLENEDDRALADVKAVFAQLEKAKIKRRVRRAKIARAKAGGHPGGKRPYGYVFADTGRTGNHDKPIRELRPVPVEVAVVNRMFQMADAGTSQRRIARILDDEGIPTANGRRWQQSTVAQHLGNPLYIGKIRRRVDGRWEVYDGQHEAIVDEALWHRVNRSRSTRERKAGGRPMKSQHVMSGRTFKCGCGSAMIAVTQPGRPDVYICRGRRDHGPEFCRQPSVRRVTVDEALLGQLTSRYFDLDGTRDRLRDQIASELPTARAAVADADRESAKVDARIAKIVRGWQDEVISDAEYKRQRVDLDAEREAAQAALEQRQRRVEQIESAGATTDAEEALLRHLADLHRLVSGTVDQARDIEALRTVIRTLFERVTLIHWSLEDLDEIKGAGVPVGEGLYLIPKLREGVWDMDCVSGTLTINQVPVPGELTASTCR
jgi:site-specific DNA recombinase